MSKHEFSRRQGIIRGLSLAGGALLGSRSGEANFTGKLAAKPNPGKVRVAVVQQETVPGAVEKNRAKALDFAREALANNADIILFHEALLVGYTPEIHHLAEPADGPSTQAFRQILQGTSTVILYGLIERDGTDFYTSATLVGARGVMANYRKTHLWWLEKGIRHEPAYFLPGNKLVTFDVKGYKSGVMICYDGDFPEMTRAYANLGCLMLFWLNNRGSRGPREVKPLAETNSMIMPTSCCCGLDEAWQKCRGGSNITDKDGAVLAEIWDKEGVIYADADPSAVPDARWNNPWYRGQRQDLYR